MKSYLFLIVEVVFEGIWVKKLAIARAKVLHQVPSKSTVSFHVAELSTLEEGKEILKNQFYFDYDIETETPGCKENILAREELLTALHPGDHTEKSINYINKYSTDMFKRIEKTRASENHPRYTLQATGAIMQQENLLTDTHHLKMKMLRYAVDGLAAQKCFVEAKDYAVRVLEAYGLGFR